FAGVIDSQSQAQSFDPSTWDRTVCPSVKQVSRSGFGRAEVVDRFGGLGYLAIVVTVGNNQVQGINRCSSDVEFYTTTHTRPILYGDVIGLSIPFDRLTSRHVAHGNIVIADC